jgi:RNA polymerase sigma factor (sigma-70 family)
LDADCPRAELVNQIESDLREAAEIRNQLIRANLRLVVSVAKKFVESANNLTELISDGNISLMRAVEKFDADRGFKFSTYATYAIRRNFYRTIIQDRKVRRRHVSGEEELLKLRAAGPDEQQISEPQFAQLKGWLGKLLNQLNPREQLIVSLRYGLQQNSEPQTLQDIAKNIGVCKERVRQLQTRALAKLQKAAELVKSEVDDLL